MQFSFSLSSILALFGVMFVLALMPTLSSLTVAARSMTSGFMHGALTTLGVVSGDIFYILLAIFGLSVLIDTMADSFVFVKYLGGAYLIWLGVLFWKTRKNMETVAQSADSSLASSYMTGFLITLADQKAVLFYLGLFPALFDLSLITMFDTCAIIATAIVSVGGAKLCYAYAADRARSIASNKLRSAINVIAGSCLIGVGVILVLKS